MISKVKIFKKQKKRSLAFGGWLRSVRIFTLHCFLIRQKVKWEQAFDAKIYGIVWVSSTSNDQLSFWLPVNTTQTIPPEIVALKLAPICCSIKSPRKDFDLS